MQGLDESKQFEAKHYKKEGDLLKCLACERQCKIAKGKKGLCGVRKNIGGKLHALNYGKPIAMHLDPIEKKPLYSFRPKSKCFSISTFGCNFACQFCQNHGISKEFTEQQLEATAFVEPEKIIEYAIKSGAEGMAYTYTEPTIFFEYALDIMKLAKKQALYNVWVSNGYMGQEVRKEIAPFLDAINIDYKGGKEFYKNVCGGIEIEKVEENIGFFHKKGIHLEIANLVVPGLNDPKKDFEKMCKFIASLDTSIPLHFSRFFPNYKLDSLPPTPKETLLLAQKIAKKQGLENVFLGNI